MNCAGVSSTADSASTVFAFYKTALDQNGWTITATDPAGGVVWFASRSDHKLGGRVIIESVPQGALINFLITNGCPCGPAAK